MANVVVLVALLLLAWYVASFVRRHRRGIVAERGMSVGADLGALSDQPRVRIRAVTRAGPDRVRLVLTPETVRVDDPVPTTSPDLDLVVLLRDEEFGFELLHEWRRSEALLAIVMPPGSRIVRLRSIADLQPLTLRRVDDG